MAAKRKKSKKAKGPRPVKTLRDRVVALKKALPGEVQDHPLNWRKHSTEQHGAMRGLFREVGYVKPVDVYIPKPGDKLVVDGAMVGGRLVKLVPGVPCLMDGHLRKADVPPDFKLSLNVTDLTEGEALKYLATCDPLAGMAEQDDARLVEILAQIDSDDRWVQEMLAGLIEVDKGDGGAEDDEDESGEQFQIVIECESEEQQRALVEQFTADGLNFRALVA